MLAWLIDHSNRLPMKINLKTNLKTNLIATTLVCATFLSANVLADNHSTMLGTWTGKSNTAVFGEARHHGAHEGSDPRNDVRFVSVDFTLVIEKEQGRNFAGYVMSKADKVPVAGAFNADMVNGVYVSMDGSATFSRTEENRLESCYTHVPSGSHNSNVAACIEYVRQ